MANLTAIIGADTSRFVEEVKSAKYMLEKFVKETKNSVDAVEEDVSVTNEQVNAYKRVVDTLDKVASGTMNTKQQQQALSASLQELKIQWANLSNTAKSSEFGQMVSSTLTETQIAFSQLSDQIQQANTEMGSGTGVASAKKQLMSLTKELTNLTVKYRAMSDAEKASAQGQELVQKMDQLRSKAGDLKDTIGDVNTEITAMASDTPNLSAFGELLGVTGDLLSAHASIIAKVTGDDKALKDAIATVMVAQTTYNAVLKIANAQETFANSIAKIRKIQTGALTAAISIKTAAEGKGVIATKAATVAQAAFNAVAKANPYVLLAAAILGVGAALFAFTKKSGEATAAEKKSQEAAAAAQKAWDDFKDTISNTGASLLSTYAKLQTEWKNLKSTYEKNKWIKDNESAFSSLGVEIDNVGDAEKFLVDNTDKIVQAFMLRAKAAAYAAKAKEMYREYIDKEAEYEQKQVRAGDPVPKYAQPSTVYRDKGGNTANGGRYNVDNALTITSYTEKGAQEANEKLKAELGLTAEAQRGIQQVVDNQVSLDREAAALLKRNGVKPKTNKPTGGNKPTKPTDESPKFAAGSLTDLENQLSELQKKYKDGLLPKLTTDDYIKKVDALKKQIESKKMELGLVPVIPEGSLEKINKSISEKQAELKLAVDDATRLKIQKEIDELTEKKRIIELKLKPVVDKQDLDDLIEDISEAHAIITAEVQEKQVANIGAPKAQKAVNNADILKTELSLNQRILSSYRDQYNLIQQKRTLGAELTDEESKLAGIYDNITNKVRELGDAYKEAADSAKQLSLESAIKRKTYEGFKAGVDSIGSLNSAVTGINDKWKSLGENFSDMSPFEQVTGAIDATISTIQSAISAYESISEMIQIFGEISELTAAKKIAANTSEAASDSTTTTTEVTNTELKMAADQQENASTIGKLGVDEAGAVAGATKSGASLPFPANLAAIAAGIAAVVAAFAMVFSCFAEGGIVQSGSKIGDHNLVRVNGGEMILNGTQQKRLFNLLNGALGYNAPINNKKNKVVFEIKGSKLAGALRNYYSKTDRV